MRCAPLAAAAEEAGKRRQKQAEAGRTLQRVSCWSTMARVTPVSGSARTVLDILRNRGVEKLGLLRHHRHLIKQRLVVHTGDVHLNGSRVDVDT